MSAISEVATPVTIATANDSFSCKRTYKYTPLNDLHWSRADVHSCSRICTTFVPHSRHALVIEDEAIIAFHIGDLVEQAGAKTVAYAQTELEAVSAAMEQKPDIIVSDVRLLTGTGPAAVTSIRLRVGRVPAIFITGNPEALDGYDHDGLMEKPFEADRLKETVARFAVDC